jgi:hypothetical protein
MLAVGFCVVDVVGFIYNSIIFFNCVTIETKHVSSPLKE